MRILYIFTFLSLNLLFIFHATATPCSLALSKAPSEAEIDKFERNIISYADDLRFDALGFLRSRDAGAVHSALNESNYKKSWSQLIPAGPLVLFHGHLFPQDFYRSMAYTPMGQHRIDNRAPHLFSPEQWAFDVTKGSFTLEKGTATKMLMDIVFNSNEPILLYRGVRGSEAERYKALQKLKQSNDTVGVQKFISENFKPSEDPAAGCFVTPNATAAASFGIRDGQGTIAVYKVEPKKLTDSIRQGIYIGIEMDYFEIAFSSDKAKAFLIDSFDATYDANEFLKLMNK